jgi:hypothetical protein
MTVRTLRAEVAKLEATVRTRLPRPDASGPGQVAPDDREGWLRALFPRSLSNEAGESIPLAQHHRDFWAWVWALKKGVKPRPFVAIWPRGGGKSTSAELACVAVGARKSRRYILYISGTQQQADDHVQNVASLLESDAVSRYYPSLAVRAIGKYGSSRGWRRNRLRTASGLTIDALGLDVAARGVKIDEARPDLIVFDDVDDKADSIETTRKKETAITHKLLPAGSSDAAAMFIQNLVHHESIAARLAGVASEPADYLANRIVSGPLPALSGFEAAKQPDGTWLIVRGEPIWQGQSRAVCQQQIIEWGIRAFRAEAQHERTPPEGQAFPEFDPSIHVCDPFVIPPEWKRIRAVDYGYAVPYCCLWLAQSPAGTIFVYRETYARGMTAGQQAYEIRLASAGETIKQTVADPSMWATQREGRIIKSVEAQYGEWEITLTKANNDRLGGAERVHAALEWSVLAPARLQIFRTCTNLIRTMPLLVRDPNKPEDVDTTCEDHAFDSLRYGLMALGVSFDLEGMSEPIRLGWGTGDARYQGAMSAQAKAERLRQLLGGQDPGGVVHSGGGRRW